MRNFFKPQEILRHRAEILLIFFLAVDILILTFFALNRSIDVSTYHLDGAYQTASALYRLADGQRPGKDFYPYLGVGLNYFLYPIFKISGNNLAASIFTSYFIVAFATSFSVGLIGALIIKPMQPLNGVLLGSLFLFFMVWQYPNLPSELSERFTPGNSLRPLRSFLPFLCTPVIYLLLVSRLHTLVIYACLGGVAGLAFLWSNDFGIPTAGLLIIFMGTWAHINRTSIKCMLPLLGAALLTASVGLIVMTGGNALNLLSYNFFDVARDQYWYYGPWTVESRILSFEDFITKISSDLGWWGLVLFAISILAYLRPKIENFLLCFIGLSLFGGGLLATIGGHRGYMAPIIFWCQVTGVIGAAYLFGQGIIIIANDRLLKPAAHQNTAIWRHKIVGSFTLLLCILAIGALWYTANNYKSDLEVAKSDKSRFYVDELGGYLPIEWKDHVTIARQSSNQTVVEEFWGLWSSILRKHPPPPVPVDAVIHALGKFRPTYTEAIRDFPDVVITTPRSTSSVWQAFLLSANWEFYKPLLKNYKPLKTSPTTLTWHKSDLVNWPKVECEVSGGANPYFVLSTSISGYYDIVLYYKNNGLSTRSLIMVRNNLNYAAGASGYLSLNPHASNATFPVVITADKVNKFDLKPISQSEDLSKLYLERCQAKKIIFDNQDVLPSSDIYGADTAFDLTNSDWIGGFAKSGWVGFFITSTKASVNLLEPNKKIRFADGSIRKIQKQIPANENTYIVLDGPPLDGNLVGFPRKFEVIE